jgi:hypothetical protein
MPWSLRLRLTQELFGILSASARGALRSRIDQLPDAAFVNHTQARYLTLIQEMKR